MKRIAMILALMLMLSACGERNGSEPAPAPDPEGAPG